MRVLAAVVASPSPLDAYVPGSLGASTYGIWSPSFGLLDLPSKRFVVSCPEDVSFDLYRPVEGAFKFTDKPIVTGNQTINGSYLWNGAMFDRDALVLGHRYHIRNVRNAHQSFLITFSDPDPAPTLNILKNFPKP